MSASESLSFDQLRIVDVTRCERIFHRLDYWTPCDWACAMAGECGEVCNAVKKMKRMENGTNTAKDPQTVEEAKAIIADELADTIIYADLLAARLRINLGEAVRKKFNEVSDRMKCDLKI
jgi:NTP pyrophosphatase (non-canonical NTP hydrolase)